MTPDPRSIALAKTRTLRRIELALERLNGMEWCKRHGRTYGAVNLSNGVTESLAMNLTTSEMDDLRQRLLEQFIKTWGGKPPKGFILGTKTNRYALLIQAPYGGSLPTIETDFGRETRVIAPTAGWLQDNWAYHRIRYGKAMY